ncbi:MAG: SRPBCC family protein [Nitrososphaerota archaeon]|nr:SRPBCC family protein [Nitrososphaerota archaeon]
MRYEASVVVKAAHEKVYSAYTDFGAAPKWSTQAKAVEVSAAGDLVRLQTTKGNGQKITREMKLFPPDRVESEWDTRFTKVSSVVKFEDLSGGTRVTATLDIGFKGLWGWILRTQGKAEAEASAIQELSSFARYVEAL